jgi:hypothetical protein
MVYEELTGKYEMVTEAFTGYLGQLKGMKKDHARLFLTLNGELHGIAHWVRVALFGLYIAEHYCGPEMDFPCDKQDVSALVAPVLAAAFFHDCARTHEGVELDHGREAEKIWRDYVDRRNIEEMVADAVAQALLFHVDHTAVDPAANLVTVCLCNGDRLDRVRLGSEINPKLMYEDGCWPKLQEVNGRLLTDYGRRRVAQDLKIT